MAKVNVYLPDDLERAVRAAGLAISPVCQVALEQAVRRVRVAQEHGDLGDRASPRLREVLGDAVSTRGDVGVLDVFGALVLHGENLGARVLREVGIELPAPTRRAGRRSGGAGRLDQDARSLLAVAVRIASEMRQSVVGTEHLVIAAASVPPTDRLLAALGVSEASLRRAVDRLRLLAADGEGSEAASV